MLAIILGVCLVSATFGSIIPIDDGRIINGQETTIDKFPFQVSFQYADSLFHFCGGSIIDKWWILTAAHCVESLNQSRPYAIRAGSTDKGAGGQRIRVEKMIFHEKYNRINKNNDIALLKLAEPLTFNDKVKPIEIAKKHPEVGTKVVVSGWGRTDPNVPGGPDNLRFVELMTIDTEECRKKLPNNPVTDNMFCCFTQGKDSCQGDSGGPLTANGQQVGVVSWGKGCGDKWPGAYTKLVNYQDWLRDNMK